MAVIGASRSELLQWLNTNYSLNLTKIEQCGNGAVYCQIFDSIFQDLNLAKVNFNATADYQIMNNYKILQAGFAKHKISREVPVEKLMKCRLQDNLEFLQWMSKLWNENRPEHYDAEARRKSNLTANTSSARRVISGPQSSLPSRRTSLTNNSNIVNTSSNTSVSNHVRNSAPRSQLKTQVLKSGGRRAVAHNENTQSYDNSAEIQALIAENEQLVSKLKEANILTDGLERERNFYFSRLRSVEILIQNLTDRLNLQSAEGLDGTSKNLDVNVGDLIDQIQGILYAPQEGFESNEMNIEEDAVGYNDTFETRTPVPANFDDAETF